MTTDDILRMAREAHAELLASGRGMHVWHEDSYAGDVQAFCEHFAALVAAAEREAIQNPQLTDVEMDLVMTEIGRFDREEIGFNGLTAAIVKIAINSSHAIRARGTK